MRTRDDTTMLMLTEIAGKARITLRPYWHSCVRRPILRVLPPLVQKLPVPSTVIGPPKRLYRTTKDWFDAVGRSIDATYVRVHASETTMRKTPWTLESIGAQAFRIPELRMPETFVVTIPDGRVVNWEGGIVTPDDAVLEDLSPEFDCERYIRGRHTAFSRLRTPTGIRLKGRAVVFATLAQDYFGHWMMDLLPRIELLLSAGLEVQSFDWFIMPYPIAPHQEQSLRAFGVDLTRICDTRQYAFITAEELVVPSYVGGCFQASDFMCQTLRSRFLERHRNDEGLVRKERRLFVSRSNTDHRRIVNEHELRNLLQPHGWQWVEPQKFTLREQAKLFASASWVISPLSSAVANLVYCRTGTRCLEIFNRKLIQTCGWNVAHRRGIHYAYMYADGVGNTHPLKDDMVVKPDVLLQHISLLESSANTG